VYKAHHSRAAKEETISGRHFAISLPLSVTTFKLSLIHRIDRVEGNVIRSDFHRRSHNETSSTNVNSRFIPRYDKRFIRNELNYIVEFVFVHDSAV